MVPAERKVATRVPIGQGEEIRIPITEEHVEVEKRPVVKEEIIVGKRPMHETKKVDATVRKEVAEVERKGDVQKGKVNVTDAERKPDANLTTQPPKSPCP